MLINQETLSTINRGLRSDFDGAFRHGEDATADAICTTIPSSTASERFDWLGDEPEMREWLGPRHLHQFKSFKYEVFPKDWEVTCRVQRNDILDGRIGIYKLQAAKGGEAARLLKVREVANALDAGDTGLCYDGQTFFDTDHPIGEDGDITLVPNYFGGPGSDSSVLPKFDGTNDDASPASPWYLMDPNRVVKPILCIEREKPSFTAFESYENMHTWMHREFLYGAQARLGTGYGLWQTCVRNENTLNIQELLAMQFHMKTAMKSDRKNEAGRRKTLGIDPKVLIVGPSNAAAAKLCVDSPYLMSMTNPFAIANTATPNPVYKAFQVVEVSWLP